MAIAPAISHGGWLFLSRSMVNFFPLPVSASLPMGKLEAPPLPLSHWLLASLLFPKNQLGNRTVSIHSCSEHQTPPTPVLETGTSQGHRLVLQLQCVGGLALSVLVLGSKGLAAAGCALISPRLLHLFVSISSCSNFWGARSQSTTSHA